MALERPFRHRLIAALCGATLVLSPLAAAAQGAAGRAPAAAAPAKELVAVLDLEAVNTDKFQASALTDRFREELLRSGRFTLVDRSQMNNILDEQALQQTGCTTSECAVQVGKILGVRKIVTGRVTKIEDTLWLISAQMVDVETAETQRAESQQHEGNFRTLLSGGIVQLANKIAQAGPAKKPDAAALAAQLPPPAPAPAAKPEEAKSGGGSNWGWWALGGVAVVGAAAAASSGANSKKSSKRSPSPTQTVNVSW